jgi:nitrite reductase/ring-hydroxylating ferredoxin subunit
MNWVKALPEGALQEGTREVVTLENRKVVLLKHQGELYAINNSCPHLKMSMKKGKITEDGAIVCPFHRSAFDLKTGEVKDWCPWPPLVGKALGSIKEQQSLPVFPTRIEDGSIWVGFSA